MVKDYFIIPIRLHHLDLFTQTFPPRFSERRCTTAPGFVLSFLHMLSSLASTILVASRHSKEFAVVMVLTVGSVCGACVVLKLVGGVM